MKENFDEYYQQIFYNINKYHNYENDQIIQINSIHRFYLYLFIFLILTSKVNTLPNTQSKFFSVLMKKREIQTKTFF